MPSLNMEKPLPLIMENKALTPRHFARSKSPLLCSRIFIQLGNVNRSKLLLDRNNSHVTLSGAKKALSEDGRSPIYSDHMIRGGY